MAREEIQRKGNPHWRVHPGEVLREEFLKPLHMSAYELAKRIRVPVPQSTTSYWSAGEFSADTAVRLSRFLGTTEQFWLNLQAAYEINRVLAEQSDEINRIQPRAASASG